MRIGVVGGGIGGLALAAGLVADGHDVVVHERRDEPGATGAGITLAENAFDALGALGLADVVRGVSSDAITGLRTGQRDPSGRWLVSLPPGASPALRAAHRRDLHRVLVSALPADVLRLGSDVRVAADGSPVLTSGGAVERYDLVVAADGVRSAARADLGLDRGVRDAGCTAWRGVTSGPVDLRGGAGETWGRQQTFGLVPLPDGRVYWFATQSPTVPPGDELTAVRERFAGWHAPIGACLDATERADVLRHDVVDLARLPRTFVVGRTVLLGDAAHAMTPNLGQGAVQAIEDAATLVVLLRGTRSVDDALARYSVLRRRRAGTVWRTSRTVGRVAQAGHGTRVRGALLRAVPVRTVVRAGRRAQRWSVPEAG